MADIITRSGNKQETPEQKLARNLLENSFQYRKLLERKKERTSRQQRRMHRRDIKEMINIIAILLDKNLSVQERLRRAGRAPASSAMVKEFRKRLGKELEKNKNLFIKLEKEKKKGLENGILGITLEDLKLSSFLKGNISIAIGLALKKEEKLKKEKTEEKTTTRAKEQSKVNTLETITKPKNIRRSKNLESLKVPTLKILSQNQGVQVNQSINKKNTLLNSFGAVNTEQDASAVIVPNTKISQVEALKKQRMEEALNPKSVSVGRTMSPYPPIPTSSK